MHIDEATADTIRQVTSIDGFDTEERYEFNMEYCQIISVDNFYPNNELRRLFLDGNQIISLDKFNINKVEDFFISENKIISIDNFDVKNLKYLYITDNPIKNIDNFDVKNLEELNANRTLIEVIDNFDVKNLKELRLMDSKVKGIYNFDAKNIEELYLHDTPIEYINDFYFNSEKWVVFSFESKNMKYTKPETLQRFRQTKPGYFESLSFDSEGFIKGLSEKEKTRIREKIKKHGEEYERQKERKKWKEKLMKNKKSK